MKPRLSNTRGYDMRPLLKIVATPSLAILLSLAPSPPAPAAEPQIIGPMPGHSAMRAVKIWLQVHNADNVALEYWPENQAAQRRQTATRSVAELAQGVAHFDIGGLTPGTRYRYRVLLDGTAVEPKDPLYFRTQPLWQWRTDPPPFRAALGSCAFVNDKPFDRPGRGYGGDYQIFEAIAAQKPDLMLWLGDTVYLREADTDSPWGIAERYRAMRAFPPLQNLLRSTHHYAIWDDHDFGPNNSNTSYIFKPVSLELFQRYWANPSYGLPETPGIFTRFSWHDVEFFLLDDRYHRNSDRAPDSSDKSMLGGAQLAWLKDALLSSPATFKVIANGSQMLNDSSRAEGWQHFPGERQGFLEWLEAARVPGVVFLSGDRHRTELTRRSRSGGYPLYELTCSPLTSRARPARGPEEALATLVPGTRVEERNFCRLDFDGPLNDRRMTIRVFDADGEPLWDHTLRARELQPARR
ncbi:MAG: alkaline phosphatase D family protein [Gammaproteobacteria bacterium]